MLNGDVLHKQLYRYRKDYRYNGCDFLGVNTTQPFQRSREITIKFWEVIILYLENSDVYNSDSQDVVLSMGGYTELNCGGLLQMP
jgi:hypothetical protein